jgi:hypothetical protein
MLQYIVTEKPLEIDAMALRDKLLICGRKDHPKIMSNDCNAEEWLIETEELFYDIKQAAGLTGRRGAIPTDIEMAENLHSAVNDRLWNVIEKRGEKSGQLFRSLDYDTARLWILQAQASIDFRTANKKGRLKTKTDSNPPSGPAEAETKTKKKKKPKGTSGASGEDSSLTSKEIDEAESKAAKDKIRQEGSKKHDSDLDEASLTALRKSMPCNAWAAGDCTYAENCRYSHEGAQKTVTEVTFEPASEQKKQKTSASKKTEQKAPTEKSVNLNSSLGSCHDSPSSNSDQESLEGFEIDRPPSNGSSIRWDSSVKNNYTVVKLSASRSVIQDVTPTLTQSAITEGQELPVVSTCTDREDRASIQWLNEAMAEGFLNRFHSFDYDGSETYSTSESSDFNGPEFQDFLGEDHHMWSPPASDNDDSDGAQDDAPSGEHVWAGETEDTGVEFVVNHPPGHLFPDDGSNGTHHTLTLIQESPPVILRSGVVISRIKSLGCPRGQASRPQGSTTMING